MAERWVGNEVWEPHEFHNRAPRPGLTVCERRPLWWRWRYPLVVIGAWAAGTVVGYLAMNCCCR